MALSMRSTRWRWISSALIATIVAIGPAARAGDPPPIGAKPDPAEEEFFEAKVRPVLADHCLECHGAEKAKAGLRLDCASVDAQGGRSRAGRRAGQARREPADRGDPIRRRRADAPQGKAQGCRDRRADRLGQAGAHWPAPRPGIGTPIRAAAPDRSAASPGASIASDVAERARSFWSFQPIGDPEPPAVARRGLADARRSTGSSSPASRPVGLSPSPPADKATLIRRVTFDLIGLPPTPEEVAAFVARRVARRLRAGGRPAAGLAALRRALGPVLARHRPLRRGPGPLVPAPALSLRLSAIATG